MELTIFLSQLKELIMSNEHVNGGGDDDGEKYDFLNFIVATLVLPSSLLRWQSRSCGQILVGLLTTLLSQ